jgi:hypothetical protein
MPATEPAIAGRGGLDLHVGESCDGLHLTRFNFDGGAHLVEGERLGRRIGQARCPSSWPSPRPGPSRVLA